MEYFYPLVPVLGSLVAFTILAAMFFRIVVPTNMVHIVQSKKKTMSYGTGKEGGNSYYHWPAWIPLIGVTTIEFPVSNFDLTLDNYDAYDIDRVPFLVHVVAFFRIADTNKAAKLISTFTLLKEQLMYITQGAVRKVLASHDINKIMLDRATFGRAFTDEIKQDLENWGVESVKNMELMDIRDAQGHANISNIMAKKSSHIEMESRTEVAKNRQLAETAEIQAKQTILVRQQEAEQAIGQRTAEKEKLVGIARQQAEQEVKTEAAVTASKIMDVKKVEQVRQAEIDREAKLVNVDLAKETTIINATAALEAAKLHANGVEIEGRATGEAEKAILLAPVQAQITLAKEIGSNDGYQSYLVVLEAIKAYLAVGTKQAEALATADVKVIATAGTAVAGADSAMKLFTPQGGLQLGGMIEAISNTPEGKVLLDAVKSRLARTEA
ncbi:hypothetical protein KKD52_16475 [Myxococcota bacterium]|nr:hypothetical protein [Myxococcota bacterium]MBU1410372.1 hypothetical protein [Myxococcota bacterium]MBU1511951.1 hypothetical protein [Myxococcota bacterium]